MVTIQILHKPLLGYGISVYINYYFNRHLFKAAKIVSGKQIGYRYKSHTYFIIKSNSKATKRHNYKALENYQKKIYYHFTTFETLSLDMPLQRKTKSVHHNDIHYSIKE